MVTSNVESLQKDGAEARAHGRSFLDNPFLKSSSMPAATGEPIDEWARKHDAWHLGWTMENAMRGDTNVGVHR